MNAQKKLLKTIRIYGWKIDLLRRIKREQGVAISEVIDESIDLWVEKNIPNDPAHTPTK